MFSIQKDSNSYYPYPGCASSTELIPQSFHKYNLEGHELGIPPRIIRAQDSDRYNCFAEIILVSRDIKEYNLRSFPRLVFWKTESIFKNCKSFSKKTVDKRVIGGKKFKQISDFKIKAFKNRISEIASAAFDVCA